MHRILYYTQRSPYARKVRILLAEKNLPCEFRITDIINKSPEFLKISPIGKVPVLVDENSTTVWDSTLIMEYLEETYPQPSFYPNQSSQRLECLKWEELADNLADNSIGLWFQHRKKEKADSSVKAKYWRVINRLLPIFDEQLATSTYLLGETLTAADIAAVCAVGYYSFRLGEDWQQQYFRLKKWFKLLHERESVKSTIPTD
jgi:glutathione S-transferase